MFGNALCTMGCPLKERAFIPDVDDEHAVRCNRQAPADRAYNLGGKTAVIGIRRNMVALVLSRLDRAIPSRVHFGSWEQLADGEPVHLRMWLCENEKPHCEYF